MKKIIGILVAVVLTFLMVGCGCKHDWVAPTCVSGGICSICGETGGDPVGHDWLEATCAEAKHCSVCGTTDGFPLKHDFAEATCTQPKTCSVCSVTEGDPLGHVYGQAVVIKEATCSEVGVEQIICRVCEETTNQDIPLVEHTMGTWVTVVKATCTTEGKKEQKCANCDYMQAEIIPMTEHKLGSWMTTIKATCAAEGTKTKKCANCDYFEQEAIPMINHVMGKWETTLEAVCEKDGIKEKKCKKCDYTETEAISQIGHKYEEGIVEEATYYEKGLKGIVCTNCGQSTGETVEYIKYNNISMRKIFDEYRSNEITAADVYEDMYIEFSGKVTRIDSGTLSYGKIYFEVSNNSYWKDELECKIKTKEQLEQVKGLSVGSNVTIRGKINFAGDVVFNRYLNIDIIEIK